jgi:prostaglandin-H2 D-isomerase / glutathione transferase
MSKRINFHYFHGRGIGEPIRLLLTVGGVYFEDRRYSMAEFRATDGLKKKLPFGQVPALEVDGVFFAQTDSLMRLAARLANLYPDDLMDAARSDMIVAHQADIHSAIAKMSFDGVPGAPGTKMLPEEERREKISAWFESTLPGLLERLENLAENGFMVGSTLCWADICVFLRLTQLLDIDGCLLNDKFPKLRAVYNNVACLPLVQTWIDAHPEDYPRGNINPGNTKSGSA